MLFSRVSVYPKSPSLTLISWEFSELIKSLPAGTYTLFLEFSRSGNDEWNIVNSINNYDFSQIELFDTGQRAWAISEKIFYRLRVTNGTDTYLSYVEPAWGSPDRTDRLKIREMQRQECLRLRKFVGSKGLLYKRKNWGEAPTISRSAAIIDPDTGDVLDANAVESMGTAFSGGFYTPFVYWLEFVAGETEKIDQDVDGAKGTSDILVVQANGLAYPFPRSNDIWLDCTSGRRYRIDSCTVKSKVRHLPVTYSIVMSELPFTHIIYKLDEVAETPGTNLSENPTPSTYPDTPGINWTGNWQ